jgi:hypothetical protein
LRRRAHHVTQPVVAAEVAVELAAQELGVRDQHLPAHQGPWPPVAGAPRECLGGAVRPEVHVPVVPSIGGGLFRDVGVAKDLGPPRQEVAGPQRRAARAHKRFQSAAHGRPGRAARCGIVDLFRQREQSRLRHRLPSRTATAPRRRM